MRTFKKVGLFLHSLCFSPLNFLSSLPVLLSCHTLVTSQEAYRHLAACRIELKLHSVAFRGVWAQYGTVECGFRTSHSLGLFQCLCFTGVNGLPFLEI